MNRRKVEEFTVGKIRVVYDKQCPVCSLYCELAQQNADAGLLELVDARDSSRLMEEITRRGLDIDEGMVTEINGELHYGSEGIRQLALAPMGKSFFYRINRMLFSQEKVARILYAGLKSARRVLLKLMGIRRINNLNRPDNDQF